MSEMMASASIKLHLDMSVVNAQIAAAKKKVAADGTAMGAAMGANFNSAFKSATAGIGSMLNMSKDKSTLDKVYRGLGISAGKSFSMGVQSSASGVANGLASNIRKNSGPVNSAYRNAGAKAGGAFNSGTRSSNPTSPLQNFPQMPILKAFGSLGGLAGKVFAQALGALGVGSIIALLTRAVVAAAKTFSEFDDKMTQVRINSQATAKEFKALRDEATRLAATTMFNPQQSAEAMNQFVKAGFDAAAAIAATKDAVNLATAANEDLGASVTMITTQLKIWNLEASQAGKVADVLVAGMINTRTTAKQLSDGLAEAGSVARQAGMDMRETTAMLGFMMERSHSASKAAIGLSSVIQRLHHVTPDMTEEIHRLGLNLDDFMEGGNVNVLKFLKALQQADPSLTAMTKIFKQRGREIIKILTGVDAETGKTGLDAIEELTDKIDRSLGLASRSAEERMSNFRGTIIRLKSAFQSLTTEAIAPVSEAWKAMISPVSEMLSWFQKVGAEVSWLTGPIYKLAGAIYQSKLYLILFLNPLTILVTEIYLVSKALRAVFGWFKKVFKEIAKTTGLDEAFKELKEILGEIKPIFSAIWTAAQYVFSALVTAIKISLIPVFRAWRMAIWTIAITFRALLAVLTPIIGTIVWLFKWMARIFAVVVGTISLSLKILVEQFKWAFNRIKLLFYELMESMNLGWAASFVIDKDKVKKDMEASNKEIAKLRDEYKNIYNKLLDDDLKKSDRIGDLGRMPTRADMNQNVPAGGFGRVGFAELGNKFQDAYLKQDDPQIGLLKNIDKNTAGMLNEQKKTKDNPQPAGATLS